MSNSIHLCLLKKVNSKNYSDFPKPKLENNKFISHLSKAE
jgi:hypothetical protein